MFLLIRGNVEREVASVEECTRLISDGFVAIETIIDTTENVEDGEQSEVIELVLEAMSIDELKDYAQENGIELGRSSSQSSIIEKIRKAQA